MAKEIFETALATGFSLMVMWLALVPALWWIEEDVKELRLWRKRKKELEAEGILAGVRDKGDAWRVENEAKKLAHEAMKPDVPFWALWA